MRQAMAQSPDVSVKEHFLQSTAESNENQSANFGRNALKSVDGHRHRHSWNSTVPSSLLNTVKTSSATTSKATTNASLAGSPVPPPGVKSPCTYCDHHAKAHGFDAAATGSSISLPLDTCSEPSKEPLDHKKESKGDRSTSEWGSQSVENPNPPLNQNQDL